MYRASDERGGCAGTECPEGRDVDERSLGLGGDGHPS